MSSKKPRLTRPGLVFVYPYGNFWGQKIQVTFAIIAPLDPCCVIGIIPVLPAAAGLW